jgi:hypothetical protein
MIRSMPANEAYRDGWDRIFSEKAVGSYECPCCHATRATTPDPCSNCGAYVYHDCNCLYHRHINGVCTKCGKDNGEWLLRNAREYAESKKHEWPAPPTA